MTIMDNLYLLFEPQTFMNFMFFLIMPVILLGITILLKTAIEYVEWDAKRTKAKRKSEIYKIHH